MATHLSESSVNSLLRLINQADNTGSYNEKVNLLKKSGILEKDQQYSSVVNKAPIFFTNLRGINVEANGVAARLNFVADIVDTANKAYIAAGFGTDVDFADEAGRVLIFGDAADKWDSRAYVSNAWAIAVNWLVGEYPDQASPYGATWVDIQIGKIPHLLRNAYAWLGGLAIEQDIQQQIREAIRRITELGIDTQKIANDTSDKLTAFFVDGTYNFTYILFPTAVLQNGATGTGTSVISSNYDSYTKLLDKKAMINTFLTQPPQPSQIALQSFDISSTFMVMETYGSSLVGKFRIDGNKLQIKDYGFDATTGTFTNFHTIYLKTEIGYVVSNYNTDNGNLHSVWYYAIVP